MTPKHYGLVSPLLSIESFGSSLRAMDGNCRNPRLGRAQKTRNLAGL